MKLPFTKPDRTLQQQAQDMAVAMLGRMLPQSVKARLSGWGEAPQWGTSATMSSVQGALRTAENGDTYLLFSLYRDMICNSLHVRGEISKRLIAVLGKPLVIQPANRANQDDVQAAKLCAEMVNACSNWLDGMLHVQVGSVYPVSAAEKIYEAVNTADSPFSSPVAYRLKKIVPVNYALYCYRIAFWSLSQASLGTEPMQPGMNMLGSGARPYNGGPTPGPDGKIENTLWWNADDWQPDMRFYDVLVNGQVNWDLGQTYKPDPMRHIIHRGNIITSFRDTFGGDLRPVLFWWLLSTLGRDWFASYMFRFGRPFVVGYANTSDKNIVDLLEKTFNAGTTVSGGAIIVNKEAKIELIQAAVSGGADGFEKYVNFCHSQITKGILGHELSTSAKNTGLGSGMADLSSDVKDEWREMDNTRLKSTAADQIFHPWLRLNGYRGNVIPCWGGSSPGNRALFAKTLVDLKNAGWQPAGDDSEQAISDTMGFKVERIELPDTNDKGNDNDPAGGKSKQSDTAVAGG